MKRGILDAGVVLWLVATSSAATLVSQAPVDGGGVSRWSQLWQDPGPNGNDLDSDAICWEDFNAPWPVTIQRLEWWGVGACELGFQIEFWKQDPGTIAYQPWAVHEFGGGVARPESRFTVAPDQLVIAAGPGGLFHYMTDLVSPVSLPANNATNRRWFVGIIGLTHQAYYPWNWAQGTGGSTTTYQFLRADGRTFRPLPEGRALLMEGILHEPPQLNIALIADGKIQLSWSANSEGFTLRQAATAPVADWATVTNRVDQYGDEFRTEVKASESRQYFQLRKD
jgi:hypothetical protein